MVGCGNNDATVPFIGSDKEKPRTVGGTHHPRIIPELFPSELFSSFFFSSSFHVTRVFFLNYAGRPDIFGEFSPPSRRDYLRALRHCARQS